MSELDLPQIPLDMGIAWEYKVHYFKSNPYLSVEYEQEFNALGAEGWEFSQFHPVFNTASVGIFKRVKLKDMPLQP